MIQGDGYQLGQVPATFPRALSTSSSQSSQSNHAIQPQPLGSGSSLQASGSGSSVVAGPQAAKILGIHTLPRRVESDDGTQRRVLVPAPLGGIQASPAALRAPGSGNLPVCSAMLSQGALGLPVRASGAASGSQ